MAAPMPSSSRTLAARRTRVAEILKLLIATHGPRPAVIRGKCLDLLVACMLTQNTNMANARSGYKQLRRAFASWNQVMAAPVRDVQRHIAVCGLARMRANRLIALLNEIKQRHGKLDLQFLAEQAPDEAMEYLLGYFGNGPKTAACTLLFAFNMPVFPVDKGIHRMCRRLKLVRPKAGEPETSKAVGGLVEAPNHYPLHVLMFRHAKDYCRPRNPKCRECRLMPLCPYGQRRARHRPPPKEIEIRLRPVILSRRASAGLVKHGDGEIAKAARAAENAKAQ
jgi:endonuclease-3